MSHIGILGTPVSSGNRGVLALAESLILLNQEAVPGAQVSLMGSGRTEDKAVLRPTGPQQAIPLVRWRLSPKGGLRDHLAFIGLMSLLYALLPVRAIRRGIASMCPWIAALEGMTLVGDVRGGDSFSDIYGMRRFLISTIPVLSVIWVKGGIVQFPQTYGPYKSRTARWIARYLLRRSFVVVARDVHSLKVAQDLLGSHKEVRLSPDVAFALHIRPPATVITDPPLAGPIAPGTIGLNVNGLMFNGGYNRSNQFGLKLDYREFLGQVAGALLKQTDHDLLLVPHTYAPSGDLESDNDACFAVRAMLPAELRSRVRIVTGDFDCHELKSIIGRCDFFIGSRMHSCIGALSQGVPCVGVAYSMKFAGVFESVGMGEWVVDARAVTTEAAVEKVLELYGRREITRPTLSREAKAARQRLTQVFSEIVSQATAQGR